MRLRSPTTLAYVAMCWAAALALVLVGAASQGQPHDWVAVLVLGGLGIASWLLREANVGERVTLSFISIILLAAAVIVGPVGAAVVGAVATLVQKERQPAIVRLFNVALFSSMGSLGGLAYHWCGGLSAFTGGESPTVILLRVGLPLAVTDVVQCLLNAVMLAGVIRVAAGTPMRSQVLKLLSTSGIAYVGYGVIGFLFVVLWIPANVGWFSAVLVLAPLFVARWAFVQYGEEFRAHERTLRALVLAEEAKEPNNVGHSERVALLSEWLAEGMALGHKEIQAIRMAGMLHDIGKVTVPTSVLRARHEHSDDELILVAGHARAGVELVRDIEFLAESLDGIAHHHERYDGLGYPAGLQGEAIPIAARIVAVADVFDALTTPRPYRPAHSVADAAELIRSRAGVQFDPQICDALDKALARHEWNVAARTEEQLAAAGSAVDHDDPEVSDRFAARADLRALLGGVPGGLAVDTGASR